MTVDNLNGLPKEIRPLAKRCKEQGWVIEKMEGSGHFKFIPPDPDEDFITISHSIGDRRAVNAMKVQLKRAGLMEADEWRKRERQKRRVQSLIESKYRWQDLRVEAQRAMDPASGTPASMIAASLRERDKTSIMEICSTATDQQLEAISLWCAETDVLNNEQPLMGCPCGWESDSGDILRIAMHRFKCDRKPKEQNVQIRPDDRDRLDCPECAHWVWVSQPHLMDMHLDSVHGKSKCPHCKRMMLTQSLDRHLREDCPTVKALSDERKVREAREAEEQRIKDTYPLVGGERSAEEVAAFLAPPDGAGYVPLEPVAPPVPVVVGPAPGGAPTASAAPPGTPPRTANVSDDDLFALLEMVLDGPVMVNRESLAAVNDWMDATRRLLAIKAEQA